MASPTDASLTTAFLAWAIEFRCPVRGSEEGRDPQRVERQLRAARAVGQARRQGWLLTDPATPDPASGLVLQPGPGGTLQGFWVAEAMSVYGGLHQVEAACRDCPAQVVGRHDPSMLAGCYGELPFPELPDPWHAAVEAVVDRLGCRPALARLRRLTCPIWYGLWCDSPLAGPALALVADVLEAILALLADAAADGNQPAGGLAGLQGDKACAQVGFGPSPEACSSLAAALRAAFQHRLAVHVQLYPPGRVEGRRWMLPAHCPRCGVPWRQSRGPVATGAGRCPVCGYVGHPSPPRRRCAQGSRPYQPLTRILSPLAQQEWLAQHPELRAMLSSEGRASVPPLAGHPDNRPAGSDCGMSQAADRPPSAPRSAPGQRGLAR